MSRFKTMLLAILAIVLAVVCVAGLYLSQPIPGRRLRAAVPEVEVGRLRAHVAALSRDSSPRSFDDGRNLDAAASFIRRELTNTGGRLSDQAVRFEGRDYRNVIASFGPDEGERIVVGAHYDAFGPFPGADDNASGVAGLLELGRLLGSATLRKRVDLVAFTLEEPPAFGSPGMGSAVHAASLRREGVELRAMVCLEMIGCFSDEPGSQTFPLPVLRLFYPGRGNFIAIAARPGESRLVRSIKASMAAASRLPVRSINAPRSLLGVDLSDHASYWDAGYPAVMVTDTAFYRNPRYHTAQDTAETLDYGRMAEVVRGVFAAVADLAR